MKILKSYIYEYMCVNMMLQMKIQTQMVVYAGLGVIITKPVLRTGEPHPRVHHFLTWKQRQRMQRAFTVENRVTLRMSSCGGGGDSPRTQRASIYRLKLLMRIGVSVEPSNHSAWRVGTIPRWIRRRVRVIRHRRWTEPVVHEAIRVCIGDQGTLKVSFRVLALSFVRVLVAA